MTWWEENTLYDLKVGDLVRYRSRSDKPKIMLVLSVSPERTCKVNTVQYVRVVGVGDTEQRVFSFASKTLTTNLKNP